MADVTISQLTRGTPTGNSLLPYSTGSSTLGVPVSGIFENSSTRVAIGSGGNNLYFRLDVCNNDFNAIRAIGNSSNSVGIYVENTYPGARAYGLISSGGAPSKLGNFTIYDHTAQAARFNIDSVGNVGIGTSTPRAKLEINSSTIIQNDVIIKRGIFDMPNPGLNRRVSIALTNYTYAKFKIYAQRTNSGDSMVWWEGVLNNNFGIAYTNSFTQRSNSGSINYSLASINGLPFPQEYVLPCTWNFDFNNTASTAFGHYEMTSYNGVARGPDLSTITVTTW